MLNVRNSLRGIANCSLQLLIVGVVSGCGGGSDSGTGSGGAGSVANSGDDPLFKDQWYLKNTSQFVGARAGEDSNVVPVWNDGIKGQGVLVAVVDDGLELAHEDLAANIAPGKSWDYWQGDLDPSPVSLNYHGTNVAGIIAARDLNGVGLRGVAPRARLAAFNLLANDGVASTAEIFDAMTRHSTEVAVSNNSWGSTDGLGEAEPPTDTLWHQGIASGIANGRSGKGTIYVWAAGNGAANGGQDNSNYDYQSNNRHVITVCAVDALGVRTSYSESGANIWLCAPGGATDSPIGITTTDLMGAAGCNGDQDCEVAGDYDNKSYTNAFLGTSAATPVVSGVVALMLEANPNLGWRDVRLILAETARKSDKNNGDWSTTSPTTGQPQYNINHNYGFGVVDAEAAVARAKTWVNVGIQKVINRSIDSPVNIPDINSTGIQQSVSVTDELVIEYVEIDFNTDHLYSGDLEIILTAPSGTKSVLAETHWCLSSITSEKRFGSCVYNYAPWTFGSVRHLGESSSGTWTLRVADKGNELIEGNLLSWTLRIYGREL